MVGTTGSPLNLIRKAAIRPRNQLYEVNQSLVSTWIYYSRVTSSQLASASLLLVSCSWTTGVDEYEESPSSPYSFFDIFVLASIGALKLTSHSSLANHRGHIFDALVAICYGRPDYQLFLFGAYQ